MAVTSDEIRAMNGKTVSLTFSDGCSVDVKVVETMHLDEGEDFIADVIRIRCRSKRHKHPSVGEAINIHIEDIISIRLSGAK